MCKNKIKFSFRLKYQGHLKGHGRTTVQFREKQKICYTARADQHRSGNEADRLNGSLSIENAIAEIMADFLINVNNQYILFELARKGEIIKKNRIFFYVFYSRQITLI